MVQRTHGIVGLLVTITLLASGGWAVALAPTLPEFPQAPNTAGLDIDVDQPSACHPVMATFVAGALADAGKAVADALGADPPAPAREALLQTADDIAAAQRLLDDLGSQPKDAMAGPLAAAQAHLAQAIAALQASPQAAVPSEAALRAQDHLSDADVALAVLVADVTHLLDGSTPDPYGVLRSLLLSTPVIVWTNLNMGAGSCLDADLLDGYQAQDFLDLIAQEAALRAEEDARLQAAIDAIQVNIDKALQELRDVDKDLRAAIDQLDLDLQEEVAARQAAIDDLQTQLDALDAALDAEEAARKAADDALHADLDALAQDLADEAAAREAADAALRGDLDAETQARKDADASEAQARADEDAALDTRVDGLEGHVNDGAFEGDSLDLTGNASIGGDLSLAGT